MGYMSTGTTLKLDSKNADQTEAIGRHIGQKLKGGEIIELISDLGGGKTTFVRGLAAGMGSTDKVASPTFTVSKEYTAGDLILRHYDFYRLSDPGILEFELVETLSDPLAVTVVEWADIVSEVLPPNRVSINIRNTGDTERQFSISAPSELGYLITDLESLEGKA